jgi:FkbM family methyltransferase
MASIISISVDDRQMTITGNVPSYLAQFDQWNAGGDMVVECARNLPAGSTFLDVGANIGIVACTVAALRPDIDVIAIEPVPDNFACLVQNAAINNLDNVQAIYAAVGDKPGKITVTQNGPWSQVGDSGAEPVDAITLDKFTDRNVSLVKVDVEGWEPHVLAGARNLLSVQRPQVVMEWNTWCMLTLRHDPLYFAKAIWEAFEIDSVWALGKNFGAPAHYDNIVHDNIVQHCSVSDLVMRPRAGANMPVLSDMIRRWDG